MTKKTENEIVEQTLSIQKKSLSLTMASVRDGIILLKILGWADEAIWSALRQTFIDAEKYKKTFEENFDEVEKEAKEETEDNVQLLQ